VGYLIPIIVLFFLLWLLVIRPQRRRQVRQVEMQNEVHLDDEIITAGGLHGYVRQLDEEVLTIEIAPDVRVRVDRRAVAGVVRTDEPEAEAEEEVDEPEELEPEQPEEPKRVTQAERSES
jgi:preprotein translocase subunit YajC